MHKNPTLVVDGGHLIVVDRNELGFLYNHFGGLQNHILHFWCHALAQRVKQMLCWCIWYCWKQK
jgi:hypothetical protein